MFVCHGGGGLGWTQYPWSKTEGDYKQGLWISYKTLPQYQDEVESCSWGCAYNKGYTAVHEMGHYFGLYHTFTSGLCCTKHGHTCAVVVMVRGEGG